MKRQLIKAGLSLTISCMILFTLTGSVCAQNENGAYDVTKAAFTPLPKPTNNMTDAQKTAYFESLYLSRPQVSNLSGSFAIDFPTASDKEAEEAEAYYTMDKVTFTELPKPTDGMTEDEKQAYFESIYCNDGSQAKASVSGDVTIMTASPPSTSAFHNLISSDYPGSGTLTASYLYTYTLKCFAPNASNNLNIRGSASAYPASDRIYIAIYDVTTGTVGLESAIYASHTSTDSSASWFDYSFAIGPLNPNHLYAFRFAPRNAVAQYSVSFTVSHG